MTIEPPEPSRVAELACEPADAAQTVAVGSQSASRADMARGSAGLSLPEPWFARRAPFGLLRALLKVTLWLGVLTGSAGAEPPLDGYFDARFGGGSGVAKHTLAGDVAVTRYPIDMAAVGDGRHWLLAEMPAQLAPSRIMVARFLADGQLDTSFSGDGVIAPNLVMFGGELVGGLALKTAADGKVLLLGQRQVPNALTPKLFVCRLNVAGNLDANFDQDGCAAPILGVVDNAYEIAAGFNVLADGRLLIHGEVQVQQNDPSKRVGFLLMLTAQGQIDASFGGGLGWVLVQPPGGQKTFLSDVLVRQDGGWVLTGSDSIQGSFVSRRLPDGSADQSWGAAGYRFIDFSDLHQLLMASLRLRRLSESESGDLFVCGSLMFGGGFDKSLVAAVKFDANGTPAAGFGNAGRVLTTFEDVFDVASVVDCFADSSGRLTLALSTGTETPAARDFALMRLLSDGNQDPRLAGIGRVRLPVDLGGPGVGGDHAFGMRASGDRILLFGLSYFENAYNVQQGTLISLVQVGPETLLRDGFE